MKLSLNKLLLLSTLIGMGNLVIADAYDSGILPSPAEEATGAAAEKEAIAEKYQLPWSKLDLYKREKTVNKWLRTKSFWKIWSEKSKLDGSLQALDKILRTAQNTCDFVSLYSLNNFYSALLKPIDIRLVDNICEWKPVAFNNNERDQMMTLTKNLQQSISKFNCLVEELNCSIEYKVLYPHSFDARQERSVDYHQCLKSLDDVYKQIEDLVNQGQVIFGYAREQFYDRIRKNAEEIFPILGATGFGVILLLLVTGNSQDFSVQFINGMFEPLLMTGRKLNSFFNRYSVMNIIK